MRTPAIRRPAWTWILATLAWTAGCFGAPADLVEHANVAIAVAPDGRSVAFSAADGDLYSLRIEEKRVIRLTDTPDAVESSPRFSPDGKELVYSSGLKGREGRSLFIRPIDGDRARSLTDAPEVLDSDPSFSADGKRVAFIRAYRHRPYSMGGWTWDHQDACVIDRDGKGFRRVTSEDYDQASRPAFVGGGETLLFSADAGKEGSVTELFTVPVDGSKAPRSLTPPPPAGTKGGSWAGGPAVAADGRAIAFISDRAQAFRYDVWLSKLDGTDLRPLGVTAVSPYNHGPAFFPDGKAILFLAGTGHNAQNRPIFGLWKAGLDGGRPVRIAEDALFTDPMHWPVAEPRPK